MDSWHLEKTGSCKTKISAFGQADIQQETSEVTVKAFRDDETPDYMLLNILAVDKFISTVPCHKLSEVQREVIENNNFILADPEADKD